MKRAVLAGFLAALLASGAAYGYWSSAGTGSGAARSGTAVALTLSPGAPASQLYPGSSADVAVTIANPNTFPVRVERIYLDSTQGSTGFSVDSAHSGCPVGALSFTTQTNGGTGWTVATAGSLDVHLTGALTMATTAANTCQGATFRVYLGTSGTGSP
ncbi:hypothetical protein [Actinoplanes sp. N902-109]|uniref:hypothetical protein n=1 Tax=Actinoplanes sp. (strain N902-109) TaxID=649831 RepID=UPI00032960EC|nr:hypothetical protein [Actinoplanes sp. N902-109]AGL14071.1 hypothetical protein L083_0561 [Actinoplanes sp. N902-109]